MIYWSLVKFIWMVKTVAKMVTGCLITMKSCHIKIRSAQKVFVYSFISYCDHMFWHGQFWNKVTEIFFKGNTKYFRMEFRPHLMVLWTIPLPKSKLWDMMIDIQAGCQLLRTYLLKLHSNSWISSTFRVSKPGLNCRLLSPQADALSIDLSRLDYLFQVFL